MATMESFGHQPVEANVVRGRLKLAGVMVLVLGVLLLSRLYVLQVVEYTRYQTLSLENHIRLQALPPVRGLILDRNGAVLARNTAVYTLQVIPEKVRDMDMLLQQVDELVGLEEGEVALFHKRLKRRPGFEKHLLKATLDDVQAARFAVNEYRFSGVTLDAALHRDYPLADLTGHVLGYVGRISEQDEARLDVAAYQGVSHTGKLGIERQYEAALLGRPGFEQVEIDAHGRTLRTISRQSATPGHILHLTLDADLQRVARNALGNRRGAVVVMEPASGEILTMVSSPAVDPNLFVDGIDHRTYQALRQLKDKPLLNRALYGRYAPGSTLKPIIALAALDAGVKPHESIFCPGWFSLPGNTRRYRCWKRTGHGRLNLHGAIEQSCDTYFYHMGARLGIEQMAQFLFGFGLGQKSGVDLPSEPTGLVPTPDWKRASRQEAWYPGEDVITAIGQGYLLTTPLQLARAAAMLANRGQPVVPKLLRSEQDAFSVAVPLVSAGPVTTVVSPLVNQKGIDQVIRSMTAVMHGPRGTARASGRRSAYRMAGKTGTAQVAAIAQGDEYDAKALPETLRDHALFIAFAPVDNPRIAIAVVVENGGSGAAVAAPIARKVMDHFFLKRLRRAALTGIGRVFG
ncbi:MAG: penicillin-binding protein 2 [Proteobacteria bacterium]|nr:penicillin-binding protein 2 [Pseudomonadota bacterium]